MLSVGMKRRAVNVPFVRRPFVQFLARISLPQTYDLIISDRNEHRSIGRNLHSTDPARMGFDRTDRFGLSF